MCQIPSFLIHLSFISWFGISFQLSVIIFAWPLNKYTSHTNCVVLSYVSLYDYIYTPYIGDNITHTQTYCFVLSYVNLTRLYEIGDNRPLLTRVQRRLCNIGCKTLFSEWGKLPLKSTGPAPTFPLALPLC